MEAQAQAVAIGALEHAKERVTQALQDKAMKSVQLILAVNEKRIARDELASAARALRYLIHQLS
jgi:hypothetical protein